MEPVSVTCENVLTEVDRELKEMPESSGAVEDAGVPRFLYHAAPLEFFLLIMKGGLLPLSTGGSGSGKYLCASASVDGATTKNQRANDVVFRIDTIGDDTWQPEGAGRLEWRKRGEVLPNRLRCRRFIQKKGWKNNGFLRLNTYKIYLGIIQGKRPFEAIGKPGDVPPTAEEDDE